MALSIFHPATPPDIRRAVRVLLAVAAVSLGYAALYGQLYSFHSPLGLGLPDVSTGANVLVDGLRAVALFASAWGIGLALAATPASAERLGQAWERVARAMARPAVAVALAAVCAVLYAVARVAATFECEPATLADLTAGTAQTPFQYRALVPALVRVAVAALPALGRSLWVPYGAVDALAAFGAWSAARLFLRPYVSGGAGAVSAAALGVFVLLGLNLATPFRHNALFFPWDTLSVAFFTAGLALLRDRRWAAYYVLFAVATLNRETTCFLTIALVLSEFGRTPLRRLAGHGAAQLALWIVLKAALSWAYAGNETLTSGDGTGLFIIPYLLNIGAVSGVPGLLLLAGTMGALWLVPGLLAGRVAEPGLRRLFRVVPVFLAGMLVVGEVLEVRVYSELIPLVLGGLVASVGSVVAEARRSARPADGHFARAFPAGALSGGVRVANGKNRPADGPEFPRSRVPRGLTAARAQRVAGAQARVYAAGRRPARDTVAA